MENILIEAVTKQGIWVILFVFLFMYTIRDSEKREANYQELLSKLSEKYNILLDVKKDIEDIQKKLDSGA